MKEINVIKKYRKLNNLTSEQLADLVFLDDSTIKKLESGKRKAKPNTMKKFIDVLNIPPKEIFNYYSNMTPKRNDRINIKGLSDYKISKLTGLKYETVKHLKDPNHVPNSKTISIMINTFSVTPKELNQYIMSLPDYDNFKN